MSFHNYQAQTQIFCSWPLLPAGLRVRPAPPIARCRTRSWSAS